MAGHQAQVLQHRGDDASAYNMERHQPQALQHMGDNAGCISFHACLPLAGRPMKGASSCYTLSTSWPYYLLCTYLKLVAATPPPAAPPTKDPTHFDELICASHTLRPSTHLKSTQRAGHVWQKRNCASVSIRKLATPPPSPPPTKNPAQLDELICSSRTLRPSTHLKSTQRAGCLWQNKNLHVSLQLSENLQLCVPLPHLQKLLATQLRAAA